MAAERSGRPAARTNGARSNGARTESPRADGLRADAEVLDSRRSRRPDTPSTGALELLSTSALRIITGHRNRAARKAEVNSAVAAAALTSRPSSPPSSQPSRAELRARQDQLDRRRSNTARARQPTGKLPARRRPAGPDLATPPPDVRTQIVPGPATSPDGIALLASDSAVRSDGLALPANGSALPPVGPDDIVLLAAGSTLPPVEQALAALANAPRTGSLPTSTSRTDALRLEHLRTGALPVISATLTPEDDVTRRRRVARPTGTRRRAELAVGRAVSQRRIWGAALTVLMVLLIPGATVLSQQVNVTDGGLSADGGNAAQSTLDQFPDAVRAPLPTTVAQPTPSPSATAKVGAQAKQKAGSGKQRTNQPARRTPGLAAGSMAGLSDAASGLGWASGAYIPGSSPSKVAAFGAWRGAGMDLATDWENRNNWNDIVDPTWLYQAWKGTPYTKVFGVAPIPDGDPSATMAGCAAGDYNDKWTQFGQNIKAAGLDDQTVIRLGWEFNGNWYRWQATDPAQFAECWRQIVGTVKQVAPKLTWDWNVNRGPGDSVVDARQAYPGDAYVDVIGVDSYDMWPGATDEASWQVQYSGPYGLKFWSDFAAAHHKKFSVPEWGVYPGTASQGHNGGDNPFYIAKMESFFKSEGSLLAFESYFDDSASYYGGSIFGPTENPAAAAKYQALVSGH